MNSSDLISLLFCFWALCDRSSDSILPVMADGVKCFTRLILCQIEAGNFEGCKVAVTED
ncbi:MAG: hypothetical protein KME21_01730 [Desmonostoc vinosum HA7617-LM4]|nr:hypothetical protein [Desmonostoc vinosum HA7617-LM4]